MRCLLHTGHWFPAFRKTEEGSSVLAPVALQVASIQNNQYATVLHFDPSDLGAYGYHGFSQHCSILSAHFRENTKHIILRNSKGQPGGLVVEPSDS